MVSAIFIGFLILEEAKNENAKMTVANTAMKIYFQLIDYTPLSPNTLLTAYIVSKTVFKTISHSVLYPGNFQCVAAQLPNGRYKVRQSVRLLVLFDFFDKFLVLLCEFYCVSHV